MKKEELYILKRRMKALCNSMCFYLCRVSPVDKKLVSVCTFEGKGGFGCNPKYVVEKLHEMDKSIKFIWFVNENVWEKEFPDYIQKVPNTLWSRAYWLSKSKVWIDNYRKPLGTVKRRGQYLPKYQPLHYRHKNCRPMARKRVFKNGISGKQK